MEFASNNEGVNGGTLSEYKRLTRQLWDLRDEAISNAFILDDVKVILQLADEIIKESTWFQFLREFGPNNEVEKSAFGKSILRKLLYLYYAIKLFEFASQELNCTSKLANTLFKVAGMQSIPPDIKFF